MIGRNRPLLVLGLVLTLTACATSRSAAPTPTPEEIASAVALPTEQFVLANGLRVVLHEDRSDPIAAVAIIYHTGSSREETGKTGFAHLFEHIMFQESENVPQDTFFARIQAAGGTLNGFTWEDGTLYFEVVPRNALEMVLWMEADRMGYLLGALTPEAFRNQQMVVMNEKRQGVDNRPYGWLDHVLASTLYPAGHPYGWTVIGSMTDLAAASVEDAKAFFRRWYGPNNATLIIAGDFDREQIKGWIERYFGEIPAGPEVAARGPVPAGLKETQSVYYEDALATVPQLSIVWPGVPMFSRDEAALDILADFLSDGKKAPLYRTLVMEKKITTEVEALHQSQELAGTFVITVRPLKPGPLDPLRQEIEAVLASVTPEMVTDQILTRLKARAEMDFYKKMESVFMKALYFAFYSVFWGSPDRAREDLLRYMAVTRQDVVRVLDSYVRGKPHVILSVVPAGHAELAVPGARGFDLPADSDTAPPAQAAAALAAPTRTPSKIDRSLAPEPGDAPPVALPSVDRTTVRGRTPLVSLRRQELPVVRFAIDVPGGRSVEPRGKAGLAWVTASLIDEGTRDRTPEELEEALALLGCTVNTMLQAEEVLLDGTCPARNFGRAVDLLTDMLATPRYDAAEFERVKRTALSNLQEGEGDPAWIADAVVSRLLFGDGPLGFPAEGDKESVESITLDDVRAFVPKLLRPECAVVSVAGRISSEEAAAALAPLFAAWDKAGASCPPPAPPVFAESPTPALYFVDVPGARQSEMRIAGPVMTRDHEDFYASFVSNYPLGGNFNSRLNMILREEKGVTYGAKSRLDGGRTYGLFRSFAAVQSVASAESLAVFRTQWTDAMKGISNDEMEWSRTALKNAMTLEFETLDSLLVVLRNIAFYGLPADYPARWRKTLAGITVADVGNMVTRWMNPDRMRYLVVGDRSTVLPQLEGLSWGPVTELDKRGRALAPAPK
jgi:zinc protease